MLEDKKTEQFVFPLVSVARTFATRMKGAEVAQRLDESLAHAKPASIIIRWDDVSVASPSFIDEFIARIQESKIAEFSEVVFVSVDAEITELLNLILLRRNFPARVVDTQ